MSEASEFESRLAAAWPAVAWHDLTVLAAVSGGADSVAMLRALAALRIPGPGRLVAAHFNHRLRGQQSDDDERFVVELCAKLGVPCEVGRSEPSPVSRYGEETASTPLLPGVREIGCGPLCVDGAETAATPLALDGRAVGGEGAETPRCPPIPGLEEAAREARYAFLRQTAARLGARYVVTGHTADDQAETILHRILRGTGIAGLSGISRARPLAPGIALLRPLLGVRRHEVLHYLDSLGQDYRIDASNQDLRFTRNLLRHQWLPELARQVNPGVVDALVRLGSLAGEVQSLIDAEVARLEQRAVRYGPAGQVRIQTLALADQPPYLVRELLVRVWRHQDWPLQAMGFAEWNAIAEMAAVAARGAASVRSKRVFPAGVRAKTIGAELRLDSPY